MSDGIAEKALEQLAQPLSDALELLDPVLAPKPEPVSRRLTFDERGRISGAVEVAEDGSVLRRHQLVTEQGRIVGSRVA